MEPAAIFIFAVPFAIFGTWVFFNPEALMAWEPGFRNVDLNEIGRLRERAGGVLLVLSSSGMVVLGAGTSYLAGILGIIILASCWFSDFRLGQ